MNNANKRHKKTFQKIEPKVNREREGERGVEGDVVQSKEERKNRGENLKVFQLEVRETPYTKSIETLFPQVGDRKT